MSREELASRAVVAVAVGALLQVVEMELKAVTKDQAAGVYPAQEGSRMETTTQYRWQQGLAVVVVAVTVPMTATLRAATVQVQLVVVAVAGEEQ